MRANTLTREQKLEKLLLLEERDRRETLRNPHHFFEHHAWIRHVDDDAGSRFRLWDAQKTALNLIVENDATIFLKSRRLGFSWLALNYNYWTMLAHQGCLTGYVAQGLEAAKEGVDRIKWIHQKVSEHSPHLTVGIDIGRFDNVQTIDIGRSRFVARPSTGAAFRGGAYKQITVDEMAYCKNAGKIHTSVKPATEGGGKSIYISTGNGEEGDGKTFHQEWTRAVSGESSRKPFFIPWQARPERDEQWKETQLADLGEARFKAEYPETAEEAFSANLEGLVYDRQQLEDAATKGRYKPATPLLVGIDWGTNTHVVLVQDTGAVKHVAGEVVCYQSTEQASIGIDEIGVRIRQQTDTLATGQIKYSYDAAGKQQAVTYAAQTGNKLTPVPFSKYKDLTINYIKQLLSEGRLTIDPEAAPVLYRQLKNLRYSERDADKIEKTDDHGADALIAALAPSAARWLKQLKSGKLQKS